jgi:hypothetical protein
MDAKNKKRIVITVSIAALLGVGGYFAYKFIKNQKAKREAEEAAKLAASTTPTPTPTPTPRSESAPTPRDYNTSAPLYRDDTMKFQDWMDANRPNWVGATNTALNNGKQLNQGYGYGNFGSSTTKAYNKYAADWRKTLNVAPIVPTTTIGGNYKVYAKEIFTSLWASPDDITWIRQAGKDEWLGDKVGTAKNWWGTNFIKLKVGNGFRYVREKDAYIK